MRFSRPTPNDIGTYLTLLAVTVPVISIAAAQIFLALAILALLLQKILDRQMPLPYPPVTLPLSLLFATTLAALIASPEPSIGLPPINKFWLFAIPALVLTYFDAKRVLQGHRLLMVLAVAAALLAILQAALLGLGSVEARVTGFMGHWMTLSGELLLTFTTVAAYLVFYRPRSPLLWSSALIVLSLALWLTLTRSVWIAALCGLILVLLMRGLGWKTYALGGLALMVVLAVLPKSSLLRIASIFDRNDPSNYARLAIWKAGVEMVRQHPWFGVGPQRISKVFYDYHPFPEDRYRDGFFPVHMHNNLLQFAAERGIPCALAWLWLMLKLATDNWKGFRHNPKDRERRSLYAVGFLSVVTLFVAGLFEFNFGDSEVLMIFLFLSTAPYSCLPRNQLESTDLGPGETDVSR
ncbi:MAG: O-antigen ligase family protein [Acidobacteriota bacterium]